jgi:drug/metabolite transporter (DMT)-like permease
MIRSPQTQKISISRIAGALCIAAACFIGVYGVFTDREHSGVVASLAGVAGVALLTRDREGGSDA